MYKYLDKIKENLSAEDTLFLKSIYAPEVVTIPPSDACMSICVTDDGKIRIYGSKNKKHPDDYGDLVYIESSDCGLSWKTRLMPQNAIGSAGVNRKTNRYISTHPNERRTDLREKLPTDGLWLIINDEGFDSANNRVIKVSDNKIHVLKQPFYLESCDRWFVIGEYVDRDISRTIAVIYSDDNGETWNEITINDSAPIFEIKPPHKGARWQQYSCEPTIVEVKCGDLLMFIRTSQDYYYMSRSKDKGITWSKFEQSPFHGTITMPVLQKLSDGRIVFFGCCTQPMPELDHESTFPPLKESDKKGIWEDVFTNRDANHLAIADENFENISGFRELFLNPIRNNADFRSIGGTDSRDKSIHQAQILELPYNKLLVHFGQNASSRKVVILDIDWLYEKGREEDFRLGLENVSTQMYIKSNLGGYKGWSGHCAYNRTNGALLVPDPEGNFKEVLQVCRTDDERLVYQKQGVVWNFPACKNGKVEVELKVLNSGVNICLTDRWYNPSDETIADYSHIVVPISEKCDWCTITINFDTQEKIAKISANGKEYAEKLRFDAPLGLCYVHIQTLAETKDFDGTLIRKIKQS